jgi:hypothetical protein
MAIGPDGQEAIHVGMASFPHPASSRARPSAPTILDPFHRRAGSRRSLRDCISRLIVSFYLRTLMKYASASTTGMRKPQVLRTGKHSSAGCWGRKGCNPLYK